MSKIDYYTIACENEKDLIKKVNQMKASQIAVLQINAPYPIPELFENKKSLIGRVGFIVGFVGALLTFIFQSWISLIDYPLDFGGKPNFSWLSYMPVTFEIGILCAAIAMFLTFLLQAKLVPGEQPTIGANEFSFCISQSDWLSFKNNNTHEK